MTLVPVAAPGQMDLLEALAGARQAQENTDDWWRSTAMSAVRTLAETGHPFTADDIRDLGVPEPDHANRWGGLLLAASREGLIRCVGAQRSTRGARRASLTRVWQGATAA